MPTGQCGDCSASTERPSFQVTLLCIKLMRTNQPKHESATIVKRMKYVVSLLYLALLFPTGFPVTLTFVSSKYEQF